MSTKRTRETGPLSGEGQVLIYLNGTNLVDSSLHNVYYEHKRIDDFVTPRFRETIAAGGIVNNPCYLRRDLETSGGGSYTAVCGANTYSTAGNGSITQHEYKTSPCVEIDLPTVPSERERAYQDAKSKAISHMDSTPFAFGEDLLELKQTIKYLRNPVSSYLKLTKEFKRKVGKKGYGRKTKEYADQFANTYLEYQFAFSPLIRSMQDAISAYFLHQWPVPPRLTARGSVSFEVEENDTLEMVVNAGASDFFDRSSKHTEDVQAGILYTVKNDLRDTQFRLGLRLKDLPETLWAVFPYSFMIDRVINISDVVRNVTSLSDPRVEILAGWVRRKAEFTRTRSFVNQTHSSCAVTVVPDVHKRVTFEYARELWKPTVFDAVPSSELLGLVKDASSVLDLLALAYKNLEFNSPRSLKRKAALSFRTLKPL